MTLFIRGELQGVVDLLANQYVKLVAKKEGRPPGAESAAGSTMLGSLTDRETWPPVENLTWVGFTNFVYRCKDLDKKFVEETTWKWRRERSKRCEDLAALFRGWKPPVNFDSGSSSHPNPRSFWTCDTTIGELDMKKIMSGQKIIPAVKNQNPPARR